METSQLLNKIDFHYINKRPNINRSKTKAWLLSVAKQEKKSIERINYIVCSDEYLLAINQEHLAHDYYTDIITFDLSEPNTNLIQSDIFISIDRVRENSTTLGNSKEEELLRVMVHGLLHLCGYGDKSKKESEVMRAMENKYVKQYLRST